MDARVTAGQLVSRHAEQLATQEKMAQQLGQAINRVMNGPRMQGNRFRVEVGFDLACSWYGIRITEKGPLAGPPQTYVMTDETLMKNTSSVNVFNTWIQAVGNRLLKIFLREPAAPSLEEGANRFLEAAKARNQHRLLVQQALEELEALGVRRQEDDAEYDVEAAIASIKRALDGRQES